MKETKTPIQQMERMAIDAWYLHDDLKRAYIAANVTKDDARASRIYPMIERAYKRHQRRRSKLRHEDTLE